MVTKERIEQIKNSPNYLEESNKIIKEAKEESDKASIIINKLGNELLAAL